MCFFEPHLQIRKIGIPSLNLHGRSNPSMLSVSGTFRTLANRLLIKLRHRCLSRFLNTPPASEIFFFSAISFNQNKRLHELNKIKIFFKIFQKALTFRWLLRTVCYLVYYGPVIQKESDINTSILTITGKYEFELSEMSPFCFNNTSVNICKMLRTFKFKDN